MPVSYDLAAEGAWVPQMMGILNVTPDSFSDGGELASPALVVQRAKEHVAAGAHWLDLGAESTRPGARLIDTDEELSRLIPALKALMGARLRARISVDTRRAAVAREALALGVHAINDVSALSDPQMAPLIAQAQVPVVVMHWAGSAPTGGTHHMHYEDVVHEVGQALMKLRDRAVQAGIAPAHIWFDPGLGFGKSTEHALILTRRLSELVALGQPILYGPSRKRFLSDIVGRPAPQCDAATAAACTAATLAGAHMLRVHNPGAVRDAVAVAAALRAAV